MADWLPNDEIEGDDDPLAMYPSLLAVRRFARLARRVDWFGRLGVTLDSEDQERVESFLFSVGIEGLETAAIEGWEDAAVAAVAADADTLWGETEEQLFVTLNGQALELVEEDVLRVALAHLGQQIADPVIEGASRAAAAADVGDDELINAAIGAATQASYAAAIVIAADAGVDHPFIQRFRLFEIGRWPVAITGNTLHLF